jgi:uncharacterized Zn finger protein (UPF0148 family)
MKSRKKTWKELKDDKCPKCKQPLFKGMFDDGYVACQTEGCDFVIMDKTKELLVKRDHNETV